MAVTVVTFAASGLVAFVGRSRPRDVSLIGRRPQSAHLATLAERKPTEFYNYLSQTWDYDQGQAESPLPHWQGFLDKFTPWSQAEKEMIAQIEKRFPAWRSAYLLPKDEAGLRTRFRILADAVGGEVEALRALDRNPAVLCIGEVQARRATAALRKGLGPEKAAEVVRKNPGVLAIKAASLEDPAGLARTAFAADVINVLAGGLGNVVFSAIGLFFAVSLGKASFDVVFLPAGLIRAVPQ